jgi:hypothetical protein
MAEYLELNRDDSGEAGSWGKSSPQPPRPNDEHGDEKPHHPYHPHKPCRWSWHLGKHMWRLLLFFVIVLVIISIPNYFSDVSNCMKEKTSNLGKASCVVSSMPSLLSGCSHRPVSSLTGGKIQGVTDSVYALFATPQF